MRRFNPSSAHPARAIQAWQILVGAAMHRQTLTPKLLAQLMYGKPEAVPLGEVLGHLAYYCLDEKLPPLASLVVGANLPKAAVPTTTPDAQREAVYAYDWFDVYPPTADELSRAFTKPR